MATLRTIFFVVIWAIVAFVAALSGIVTGNPGFWAISIAILFVGGLTTRAPDESRLPPLTDLWGRYMAIAAVCLGTVGVLLVWIW
jgi:hypothetical protein